MPERSLPSGMAAFLFSDIVGSTALLRRVGGDYRHHLGQYRALLLDVLEKHNGSPLGSEGTPLRGPPPIQQRPRLGAQDSAGSW